MPRKRFAQHWLKSQQALQTIIEAAELKADDDVLEIGPGTGILTRELMDRVKQVIAVEVDRDLFEKLQHQFHQQENLILLQGDILHLDLSSLITPLPQKVVANIPYNITGPILERLLGSISQPSRQYEKIILLVQKEIAERLCAKASSKTFGALSVRGQYLAQCELVSIVPAKAFSPPPKVDSAIISLIPRPFPLTVNSPELLEKLVKLGSANRRKMLRNNLKTLISAQQLQQILEQLEVNPLARAEDISVSNWVRLCNQLG